MREEQRVELQAAMVRAAARADLPDEVTQRLIEERGFAIRVLEAAEELAKSTSTEIEVDGDTSRDQVLALGGFDYTNPDLTDGTFPLDGERKSGKWKIVSELTQVGYCRNTAEALQKLKEKGIRPLTPREFIFWLVKNRAEARDKFIGILGTEGKDRVGGRCSACFNGVGGSLDLRLIGVGHGWREGWWFVGVRESAPEGAQD
jgi:hypothetical protein